jgi:hypothetical protein
MGRPSLARIARQLWTLDRTLDASDRFGRVRSIVAVYPSAGKPMRRARASSVGVTPSGGRVLGSDPPEGGTPASVCHGPVPDGVPPGGPIFLLVTAVPTLRNERILLFLRRLHLEFGFVFRGRFFANPASSASPARVGIHLSHPTTLPQKAGPRAQRIERSLPLECAISPGSRGPPKTQDISWLIPSMGTRPRSCSQRSGIAWHNGRIMRQALAVTFSSAARVPKRRSKAGLHSPSSDV